jgi:hypothetical protein
LGYINRNAVVEKSKKGRRAYSMNGYAGQRELWPGDIYVDPETHILMRYQKRPATIFNQSRNSFAQSLSR